MWGRDTASRETHDRSHRTAIAARNRDQRTGNVPQPMSVRLLFSARCGPRWTRLNPVLCSFVR